MLAWRSKQQSRGDVRLTIEKLLDKELPGAYGEDLYNEKCDAVYMHVYDSYYGDGKSLYGTLI
ncbi:hypothetical protein BOW37_12455 [Solemya velum gill symbiont]|uniref:hypothetical protein n=1 Tax=Solemya velum gill symbiont TaxID=2340 RepID=UPI000998B4D8|nr:hypothetical protein [Solemya velum gill symbiont]OOZ43004.1 hypothetical protein BOW37_12455 [Solemya velum gill symbiont]OOZ62213.1 hypothetical protein BOW45_12805 [Solemya velum gill symbiont]